ncbi:MAG: methyltransferase [bacterium]
MVDFTVDGTSIRFETRPDLFSPKGLDKGTELLLQAISKLNYDSALDWGCGWGAMALWLAARQPKAQVYALDSDMSAVKAIQGNLSLNTIQNLEIIPSAGYEEFPESLHLDLIVSHPPTHRGRVVVESMIEESKVRLNPGGKLVIVVESRLKPWVKRALTDVFGDCETLLHTHKHVVMSATLAES